MRPDWRIRILPPVICRSMQQQEEAVVATVVDAVAGVVIILTHVDMINNVAMSIEAMSNVVMINMAMDSVAATTFVVVEEAMVGVVKDIVHSHKTTAVISQHVKFVEKLVTLL
jgi:hypothetical protein